MKGRVIEEIYKDDPANPYFCIRLKDVKEPFVVFYGREGWEIDPNKHETRAKYSGDNLMIPPFCKARVVASIDISGPMDEVIKLIELAGYHKCNGPSRPVYLHVPKKFVSEVSNHMLTLELIRELQLNNPDAKLSFRTHPLERPTKYDNK